VEGSTEALPFARRMAEDLKGTMLTISTEHKALYHAAACVTCNYLVTLLDAGLKLMEAAGIEKQKGMRALMPLIISTVHNVEASGPTSALTGPIARGDINTVTSHLEAIDKWIPQIKAVYKALGAETVSIAFQKGTIGENCQEEFINLFRRD